VQIKLVVGGKEVLQPMLVPQKVRKVLRPEDDCVDGSGRKIDLVNTALGTDDPGPPLPEGGGQPFRK
jgi:hypothetical protein